MQGRRRSRRRSSFVNYLHHRQHMLDSPRIISLCRFRERAVIEQRTDRKWSWNCLLDCLWKWIYIHLQSIRSHIVDYSFHLSQDERGEGLGCSQRERNPKSFCNPFRESKSRRRRNRRKFPSDMSLQTVSRGGA